jgi:hypothetical protein
VLAGSLLASDLSCERGVFRRPSAPYAVMPDS